MKTLIKAPALPTLREIPEGIEIKRYTLLKDMSEISSNHIWITAYGAEIPVNE
jgi:hypothetical protein